MEKKYAFSKAKGNEEALGHMKTPSRAKKKRMQDWSREFDVTGDIDLLHIEIDGRFASVKEIRDLVGDINREYRKLHHQAYAKAGVTKIPRAHTPFKHEAQAQLLHQAGNIVGKELDKAGQNMVIGANGLVDPGKAYITMDTIGAIGHPGDAFQISSSHGASGLSFAARDLQRSEVGTILRRGQDDARRLFLENSREGGAFRHQLMRSNQYGLPTWPESVTNKRWPEGTGDTTFGY